MVMQALAPMPLSSAGWIPFVERAVRRWHRRRGRRARDGDDLVQEVLLRVLQRATRTGEVPAIPLVIAIARNVWREQVRELVRNRRLQVDIDAEDRVDPRSTARPGPGEEVAASLRRWATFHLRATEREWQMVAAIAMRQSAVQQAAAEFGVPAARASFLRRKFLGLCADQRCLGSLRHDTSSR
jgi:DNA-directed RNA polymerase specialized sigma24 family protein